MKRMPIRFLPALLFAVSGSLSLTAQNNKSMPGLAAVFKTPGYVILSSGDTLYGSVRILSKYVENNPVEIKFTSGAGVEKNFIASEIKGCGQVSYLDIDPGRPLWDDYLSVPSFKKGVPVFMNRLIPGVVTVLQNRSAAIFTTSRVEERTRYDGIGFTWVLGEGLTIGPRYRTDYRIIKGTTRYSSYFAVKNNAQMIKVEKENYPAVFESLFGDCKFLEAELNKNPDLREFKNFLLVAELYNQLCR